MKQTPQLLKMQPTCGDCRCFRRTEGEAWGICKAGPAQSQMLIDDNGDPYQVTFWPQMDVAEGACEAFKAGQ